MALEKEVVVSDAPAVAIDGGIKTLAFLSDGTAIESRIRDYSKIKELQHDLHLHTRARVSLAIITSLRRRVAGRLMLHGTNLPRRISVFGLKSGMSYIGFHVKLQRGFQILVLEDIKIPNLVKGCRCVY